MERNPQSTNNNTLQHKINVLVHELELTEAQLQLQDANHHEQLSTVAKDAALRLSKAVATVKYNADAQIKNLIKQHETEKSDAIRSLRVYRAMILDREVRMNHEFDQSKKKYVSEIEQLTELLLEQVQENKRLVDEHDKHLTKALAAAEQKLTTEAREERIQLQLDNRKDQAATLETLTNTHEERIKVLKREHEIATGEMTTKLLKEQFAIQQGMKREFESTFVRAMDNMSHSCQAEKEEALFLMKAILKTQEKEALQLLSLDYEEKLRIQRQALTEDIQRLEGELIMLSNDGQLLYLQGKDHETRLYMKLSDMESSALRETERNEELLQLFAFMQKTVQDLSTGTVEKDDRISYLEQSIYQLFSDIDVLNEEKSKLQQQLSTLLQESTSKETNLQDTLETIFADSQKYQQDLHVSRIHIQHLEQQLKGAYHSKEQGLIRQRTLENEKESLYKLLENANQGTNTIIDMMRYIEEREGDMKKEREQLESAHKEFIFMMVEKHKLEQESEKMNCERLRDQLVIMDGRHREELMVMQRQHEEVLRAIRSDHHATIQLLKTEISSPSSATKTTPKAVPVPLPSSQLLSSTRLEYGLTSPTPIVLSSHQGESTDNAEESYTSSPLGQNQPMGQIVPPLSTEILSSPQSPPPPPSSPPPPLPSSVIVAPLIASPIAAPTTPSAAPLSIYLPPHMVTPSSPSPISTPINTHTHTHINESTSRDSDVDSLNGNQDNNDNRRTMVPAVLPPLPSSVITPQHHLQSQQQTQSQQQDQLSSSSDTPSLPGEEL